jgi:hypothetical protein
MRECLEERCLKCLKFLGGHSRHKHFYITFSACQRLACPAEALGEGGVPEAIGLY